MTRRLRGATLVVGAVLLGALVVVPAPAAEATMPGLDGKIAVYHQGYIRLIDPRDGSTGLVTEGDNAAWAPSGDLLAVLEPFRIYTVLPDGSGRAEVVYDDCLQGRLTWSPDGSEIAYQACGGISIVDVETKVVTPVPNSGGMNDLAWSPDGAWIAGDSGSVDGSQNIWKIRPDGSDRTEVLDRPGHQVDPSWSPNGSSIAFEDWIPGTNTDISVVPADGGVVTNLTHSAADDIDPAWSPSGRRIAFISSRQYGGLFTMAAGGGDVVRVFEENPGSIGFPDWQPAQITLDASKTVVDSGGRVQLQIRVANPATNVPQVLVQRRAKPGGWTNVAKVDVDSSGRVSVSLPVHTRTLFRAIWAGDPTHPGGTSVSELVKARALVSGAMSRYAGTSGPYHLYHLGQRVWYTGSMKPNRSGEKLCFEMQSQRNRGWHTEFVVCYRIQHSGKSSMYVTNVPLGAVARIRASYRGAPDLLADEASWSYLRITR